MLPLTPTSTHTHIQTDCVHMYVSKVKDLPQGDTHNPQQPRLPRKHAQTCTLKKFVCCCCCIGKMRRVFGCFPLLSLSQFHSIHFHLSCAQFCLTLFNNLHCCFRYSSRGSGTGQRQRAEAEAAAETLPIRISAAKVLAATEIPTTATTTARETSEWEWVRDSGTEVQSV